MRQKYNIKKRFISRAKNEKNQREMALRLVR